MTSQPPSGGPMRADHPQTEEQGRIERAHAWVLEHWPTTLRRRLAVTAVVIGVGLVVISAVADLLDVAHDLGLFAYLGLMLVCWIGAGGALVPVPGVRPLSWIMIVQQASSLDPVLVSVFAALAMALGQTSLFIATRVGQHHLAHKHAHHYLTIGAGATDAAVLQAADHAPRPTRPPRPWDPIVVRSQALLMRGRWSVSHRMVTHPPRIIFVLSVIPNPLTTFATVTASAVGVSFTHFFAASLAGFLVLTSALVILGQGMLQALRVAS